MSNFFTVKTFKNSDTLVKLIVLKHSSELIAQQYNYFRNGCTNVRSHQKNNNNNNNLLLGAEITWNKASTRDLVELKDEMEH